MQIRALFRIALMLLILAAWTAPFHGAAQESPVLSLQPGPGDFMPGEILVKFEPTVAVNLADGRTSSSELNAILAEYGLVRIQRVFNVEKPVNGETYVATDGQVKPLPDLAHTYRLYFDANTDIWPIIKRLSAERNVVYAEPNYRQHFFQSPPVVTPNDPYYSTSGTWGQPYQDMYGLYRVQANAAWAITQGSSDIIVAVIDTGADLTHPDLAGKLVPGHDFADGDDDPTDDFGHGTHCAGIIGARTNNAIGVAGVCWNCRIMPLKAGNADSLDMAVASEAVRYAVDHGARVTSNSYGTLFPSQTQADAFAYAHGCGVVNLAAAGNQNIGFPNYPAALDTVLAVAATDPNDARASFSNWGNWIEISAPGVDILSLRAAGTDMYGDGQHIIGGQYYRSDGTSMSCPYVAGVAALLLSLQPSWTPNQVYNALISSADDLGEPGRDQAFGYGRLNAYRALQYALPSITLTPTHTSTPVTPTPTTTRVHTPTPTSTSIGTATPTLSARRLYIPVLAKGQATAATVTPTRSPTVTPTRTRQPGTITLTSVGDADVAEAYPNVNRGMGSTMWVGYDEQPASMARTVRSLVRFNLASIPSGATINSARLRLYLVGSYDYADHWRRVTAYRPTADWSETTVTWNSAPGFAEAYGYVDVLHGDWDWYEMDVTELVRAWMRGAYPNHGVMVRGPEISGDESSVREFSTREGLYPPELMVDYR